MILFMVFAVVLLIAVLAYKSHISKTGEPARDPQYTELLKGIDEYIEENYVKEQDDYEDLAEYEAAGTYMASAMSTSMMGSAAASCEMIGSVPEEDKRRLEDAIDNLDKTFMELVFSYADEKGMTDVEVQKRANLDRKAFSKLKCGTTKNPSKATALALAVALELDLDDTRDLLSRAGLALSPCSKQDIIVQYFIEREAYDIYAINLALFEHGEQLLGTQVS